MAFKVQVGPPQISIHQGQTVLISELDGQINWPSEKGLYFLDSWTRGAIVECHNDTGLPQIGRFAGRLGEYFDDQKLVGEGYDGSASSMPRAARKSAVAKPSVNRP